MPEACDECDMPEACDERDMPEASPAAYFDTHFPVYWV